MIKSNKLILIDNIRLLLEATTELGITAREYVELPICEDIIKSTIERMSSYNENKKYAIVNCAVNIALKDDMDIVALNRALLDSNKKIRIKFEKEVK